VSPTFTLMDDGANLKLRTVTLVELAA